MSKPWTIFNIVKNEKTGKKYWSRIGSAWLNSDGSYNLKFESFPVGNADGLQMRPQVDKDEQGQNFGE